MIIIKETVIYSEHDPRFVEQHFKAACLIRSCALYCSVLETQKRWFEYHTVLGIRCFEEHSVDRKLCPFSTRGNNKYGVGIFHPQIDCFSPLVRNMQSSSLFLSVNICDILVFSARHCSSLKIK